MKTSKLLIRIVAVIIIAATICLSCNSCGSQPPEMEDVYGRIVELIEKSGQVNMYLFGEGLPVYRFGSEYADIMNIYDAKYGDNVYDEYVSLHCTFISLDDMKQKSKEVYSETYLESVFESVFTGIMSEDSVLYARYTENSEWFYQSTLTEALPIERRVYDYSTMEIVMPSDSERIKVKLESYNPSNPDNRISFTLTFVYENGNWFLDSPTY